MTERGPNDLIKVVVPCAVLAVVDIVALIVAIATGHYVLAVVAGLLFVPLATLAGIGAGMLRRDPEPAPVQWRSKQPWTQPLTTTPEHGLVIAAARAMERIAGNSGTLGEHRPQFDLAVELDQIDEQAYRIAIAEQQTGTSDPILDQARQALVDRVTTLTAYADGDLDALSTFLDAREGDSFG